MDQHSHFQGRFRDRNAEKYIFHRFSAKTKNPELPISHIIPLHVFSRVLDALIEVVKSYLAKVEHGLLKDNDVYLMIKEGRVSGKSELSRIDPSADDEVEQEDLDCETDGE